MDRGPPGDHNRGVSNSDRDGQRSGGFSPPPITPKGSGIGRGFHKVEDKYIHRTSGSTSLEENMRETLVSNNVLGTAPRKNFMKLFGKFLETRSRAPMDWKQVEPLDPALVMDFEKLPACPEDQSVRHELLDKLVILKLNGGLGSTMGCTLPKSAIEVRQEMSFLDMTVRQVEYLNSLYGVDVPLLLMNSFKTDAITMRLLNKYRQHNLTIHTFMQSCFPRIVKDTLQPLPQGPFSEDNADDWYPPGHGDLYQSLFQSGLLDNLIEQGKEYMFISNVDNLGATVDLNLLYHLVDNEIEFCTCVVDLTRADHDGGVLAAYKGKPAVVELSQVPKQHMEMVSKQFTLFNTNNTWINLRALHALCVEEKLSIDLVTHERVVDRLKILQLETTIGSVIKDFTKVVTMKVPRSRYLPVKSTSDLFLVQSNLYSVSRGMLIPNPSRPYRRIPLIKLGEQFVHIQDYLERIPHGVPDIVNLEHLTVAGDVLFGANVTLRGTVIIVANEGSVIMIPDGTLLEDKVVEGNLRILDH